MARVRRMGFHVREAVSGIKATGVMNLATITTVALSLFILGMFLLFLRNLNEFLDDLRTQYQVTLFLRADVTEPQREAVVGRLEGDPDVVRVTLIPRELALQTIREELEASGTQLPALDQNPLPDCIEFQVKEGANFTALLERFLALPGVSEVSRGQEWVGRIMQVVTLVRVVGLTLVLILGTASLLIVANTIKLTVYARRQEIEIMKLVGATNWFIRIPFLIEGFLQGLMGAALAVGILMLGYHVLVGEVIRIAPFVRVITDTGELTKLSLQIGALGVVLGLLGSLLSLRKVNV